MVYKRAELQRGTLIHKTARELRRTLKDRSYCRSTVKRLIEYPSAAPMKTSDKK